WRASGPGSPETTWPSSSSGSRPDPSIVGGQARGSDSEPHVEHVALPDHVVAALHAEQALRLGPVPPTGRHQVLEPDDLGPDEPALEVGVDGSGCLRRGCPPADLPRSGLVLPGGEERDQLELSVARGDPPARP